MGYRLFLDDERLPPRDDPSSIGWVVIRSYDKFVSTIKELGMPVFISFDHDLGENKTGMDCAKWLIESDLDNTIEFPKMFSFYVHSQNPIGKSNIEQLLNSYLMHSGRENG